jgi:hypothetical protein
MSAYPALPQRYGLSQAKVLRRILITPSTIDVRCGPKSRTNKWNYNKRCQFGRNTQLALARQ